MARELAETKEHLSTLYPEDPAQVKTPGSGGGGGGEMQLLVLSQGTVKAKTQPVPFQQPRRLCDQQ